ncbi:GTP-binding protein [Orbilia oligospora]|uniref:GTP-binding protein n=1 Tax=Orbilia oligospora TaxID=2813651 RepID=A0A7C8R2Q4_ORBOL|nr:GTP-binding protein [Orbilia oligospora]
MEQKQALTVLGHGNMHAIARVHDHVHPPSYQNRISRNKTCNDRGNVNSAALDINHHMLSSVHSDTQSSSSANARPARLPAVLNPTPDNNPASVASPDSDEISRIHHQQQQQQQSSPGANSNLPPEYTPRASVASTSVPHQQHQHQHHTRHHSVPSITGEQKGSETESVDNNSKRKSRRMPAVKQRKVAIVGSRAVGKSSLTVQFVENHFVESYYPTIENTFSTVIKYKGQDYSTEIVDTAGQDEYSILQSKHSIGIHGYLIAYSVTSRQSFDMVTVIRDKILNHLYGETQGAEWVPCVLVGNKSDLHIQRQVSPEEGKALAEEWKCSWTETSARHNENVAKAFELLIAEIEKSQNPAQPPNGGKCVLM